MTTTVPRHRGAIPTTYKGVRFRSRLEARYATFFDLIGWSWVYEPFDTEDWIPDFLVQGAHPFLVEVGPCETWADYSVKAAKPLAAFPPIPVYCERVGHDSCHHDDDGLRSSEPDRVTLILGTFPVIDSRYGDAAGLLTDDGLGAGTDPGIWGRCPLCHEIIVSHATGSYTHRPCGHHHDSTVQERGLPRTLLEEWNRASSYVQWRPAAARPR